MPPVIELSTAAALLTRMLIARAVEEIFDRVSGMTPEQVDAETRAEEVRHTALMDRLQKTGQ